MLGIEGNMVWDRIQWGDRSTGISNRGRLIQEIGYNGVQRARGTTGRESCRRNRKERTVVTEGTKEEAVAEEAKRKGQSQRWGHRHGPELTTMSSHQALPCQRCCVCCPHIPPSPTLLESKPWLKRIVGENGVSQAFCCTSRTYLFYMWKNVIDIPYAETFSYSSCPMVGDQQQEVHIVLWQLEADPLPLWALPLQSISACWALASGHPAPPSCLLPTFMVSPPLLCNVCPYHAVTNRCSFVQTFLCAWPRLPSATWLHFFNDQETFERKERTVKF